MRVLIFLLCGLALASPAMAADWTITPSAQASFFVDDNVFLEDEEGYGWSYGASVALLRETRRTALSLTSTADFQDFIEDSDFDRFNHSHVGSYNVSLSRRWNATSGVNIRVSEAQGQTLIEEGIDTDDSTRYDIGVSQSLSYSLTKRMSLTGSYSYRNQINENDELTDSRSHTGSLSLSRTFTPRLSASVNGSYTATRFDDTVETGTVGLLLSDFPDNALVPLLLSDGRIVLTTVGSLERAGLTTLGPQAGDVTLPGIEENIWGFSTSASYQASKRLTLTGDAGVSLVDNTRTSESTVYTGSLGAAYTLRPGTLALKASRSIRQTVFTGSTITNSVTLNFGGYQPVRNLTLGAGVGYNDSETISEVNVSEVNDQRSETLRFNASAVYSIPISRAWSANLGYSFLVFRDLEEETTETSNRATIGISWSMPYKL